MSRFYFLMGKKINVTRLFCQVEKYYFLNFEEDKKFY